MLRKPWESLKHWKTIDHKVPGQHGVGMGMWNPSQLCPKHSQIFRDLPVFSWLRLSSLQEFCFFPVFIDKCMHRPWPKASRRTWSGTAWHSSHTNSTAALSCQQFCDYVEAFHLRLHWEITGRFTPVATSFATNFFRNSSNFLPSLRQKQSARLPWNLRHRWNSNSATRRNF